MMKARRPDRGHAALLGLCLAVGGVLMACGSEDSPFTAGEGAGPGTGGEGATQGGSGPGGSSTGGSGTGGSAPADADGDGYTIEQGDCNDGDPDVHPGATEICDDLVDNNCNGATDANEPDVDGDGYGPCQGDCDDTNPDINPAATEVPGDSIDNNCDGVTDGDLDGDGFTEADGDCDDENPDVYPGAEEDCYDGIDNDCDLAIDGEEPDIDGDGAGPCDGDCAEGDPSVGPNQPEIPNDGIDNNCDNLVDQDIDGDGWTVLNGDCQDDDPAINPGANEICDDNIDNDCDLIIDTDCLTACELAAAMRSSVGCYYYAVDMENYSSYNNLQYAVVVSNVSAAETANVVVQEFQGGSWQTIQTSAVGPLSLHEFDLPDKHVDNTNYSPRGAYKVVSDFPVIAYQFNPVDGVSSYTSDASLLLPTSSLDTHHHMVGYPHTQHGHAQTTIVASEDGTSVTITPSVNTLAGGAIPAMTAGQTYPLTQVLSEGDFLQISSNEQGTPFTGTIVESNHPVAVFSGHKCVNIPATAVACDHLEEQMFGLQTWGKKYVASRMPVRSHNKVEETIWHVLASVNNTSVSFIASPGVTGLPASPQVLQQGDWLDLTVSGTTAHPGDFIVTADQPIHIMGYLTCSSTTDAPDIEAGDPAMTQMVPAEQFLDNYVVLVPPNWIFDHLIITKAVGETVSVDGTPVAQAEFIVIDDGVNPVEYEVARIAASDGVHTLDGTAPFGVVVVGFDSYDSYAYPGGLNQQVINPIN